MKQWFFRETPNIAGTEFLAEQLGVSSFLVQILSGRGTSDLEQLDAFLSPHLRLLAPLELWPGVLEAANLLVKELSQGKKLLVWGDYDVDGITSTAMVLDVLEHHGIEAKPHLPDRMREGYGLNIASIEKFADEGIDCILTVDCGISDVAAITRAKELGLTVIISDHHLPPPQLPPAQSICNPRMGDCPCPHLAGVGIAFFLMAAVNSLLEAHSGKRMDMRNVLDLVALGTLADVVPLTGQNRILVKNGLLKIAEAKRPGISELKAISGYAPAASLNAGQVVFSLAPRINAAGRLGTPRVALDLLRAQSHEEASTLAHQLNQLNSERRSEENRILQEAYAQAEKYVDQPALVVYGPDWHQGVIGIVASRLVDAFYRPTLVLCDDQGSIKGSGRSINEFDLYVGLRTCSGLLLGFGGHRQAAGLRIEKEQLESFRQAFNQTVMEQLGEKLLQPSLRLDAELGFEKASDSVFLHELELLQPFGVGNPEPVFASPPLRIKQTRLFGHKKEHLQLEVTDEQSGITLQAKLWNQATLSKEFVKGSLIHLAYSPGINAYSGVASVELKVKDWNLV